MPEAIEPTPLPDAEPQGAAAATVASAVAALAAGEVVALPTETVYGLAVRADRPACVERLRAVKGSPATSPFTWHRGAWPPAASEPALEWPGFGARARRLADRYWPGPLTLVLPGNPPGLEHAGLNGWTGVRVPAHRGARAVLSACPFPVAVTSANASGEPPLLDADAVRAAFGVQVAVVADGGPSRLGEASTVLALGPGRFELLRGGLLDRDDLVRTSGRRICFVCTGNTCRSPMARTLAVDLLRRALLVRDERELARVGFEVGSFGVHAAPGAPASRHAVTAMGRRGLDLSRHAATPAAPSALAGFDEVYGLTRGHVQAVAAVLPPRLAERVRLLDPQGRDVADPVGGSLEDYLACAEQLERALVARLADWV